MGPYGPFVFEVGVFDRLLAILMGRPDGLNHEGYWRILIIVRFLLFVPIALWASICIVGGVILGKSAEGIVYGMFGFALAFGVVWGLNLLIRLVGWVVAGFKEDKM